MGCEIGVGKRKYEEVQEEGSGPKVQSPDFSHITITQTVHKFSSVIVNVHSSTLEF